LANRNRKKTADPQRPYVVNSLGKVAEFFGVAVQTVKEWRKDPSMPGDQNAWPLDEIARWKIAKAQRSDRGTAPEGKPTSRDVVAERRAELLSLDIAKAKGMVVDVDFVARLLERHVTVHHTLTEDLKDKVMGLLPRSVAGDARKRIVTGVDKAVRDLRFAMASAVEEWEFGPEGRDEDAES
jgi:hypothetical protein